MFSEPQTVLVEAVPRDLPRVGFGDRSGVFQVEVGTETTTLRVSHSTGKRNRRTVRLDFTLVAADPLLDGVSRPYSMSAYLVIDTPLVGLTAAAHSARVQALIDWLDTPANLAKVLGGES